MDADQSKIIVECSPTTFSRITNVVDLNPAVEEIVEENDGFNLIEDDTQNDSRKIWFDTSIKLLLSVYGNILPKVGKTVKFKNKKKMYLEIQRKLFESGYEFSLRLIENKLRTLEKNYKKTITDNKKTGNERSSCLSKVKG